MLLAYKCLTLLYRPPVCLIPLYSQTGYQVGSIQASMETLCAIGQTTLFSPDRFVQHW